MVLWIGVFPESLFGQDAHTVAYGCLDLLYFDVGFGITDAEVEFCREDAATAITIKAVLVANIVYGTRAVKGWLGEEWRFHSVNT